jgi:hypothetical protein
MTREIPQKFWASFCARLKDWYRGNVSIRWIQPGGKIQIVADDMPLQTVAFEKKDHETGDTVTIETGLDNDQPSQYQITEPIHILLRQDDESGRYNEVEILAQTGKTEIIFRPGIDSGLLEKLAA